MQQRQNIKVGLVSAFEGMEKAMKTFSDQKRGEPHYRPIQRIKEESANDV